MIQALHVHAMETLKIKKATMSVTKLNIEYFKKILFVFVHLVASKVSTSKVKGTF